MTGSDCRACPTAIVPAHLNKAERPARTPPGRLDRPKRLSFALWLPSPHTAPDLFGSPEPSDAPAAPGPRPLADRLRPTSLTEVVGQDHLLGPDGTLTRMLERGSLASLILWGPPGSGKTTIARLLARDAGLHFVQLSAVFSGVADLKRAFDEAARRRAQANKARCSSSMKSTASTAPSRTDSCRWWKPAPSP